MRELEHIPSRNFGDGGKDFPTMREATFRDFPAVARERGHTAESLADRFRGKIENASEFCAGYELGVSCLHSRLRIGSAGLLTGSWSSRGNTARLLNLNHAQKKQKCQVEKACSVLLLLWLDL
jgi:hypothetical protein